MAIEECPSSSESDSAVGRTGVDGRVALEVFLGEGFAALDRPRLITEHKGSQVLRPSAQRRRGSQPRSETLTVRFTSDELTLLGQAAAERGPSLSVFIADAAVAVAGNRIIALLPHERAVRAVGGGARPRPARLRQGCQQPQPSSFAKATWASPPSNPSVSSEPLAASIT